MSGSDFDYGSYYHFQNGELIEKSDRELLSETAWSSLIGREGGPVFSWAVQFPIAVDRGRSVS